MNCFVPTRCSRPARPGAQSSSYYEFISYCGDKPARVRHGGVVGLLSADQPAAGAFTATNPCFNPTSALQYARVCPRLRTRNGQHFGRKSVGRLHPRSAGARSGQCQLRSTNEAGRSLEVGLADHQQDAM